MESASTGSVAPVAKSGAQYHNIHIHIHMHMSVNLKNDVAEVTRGIGSKRTGGEENLQMRKNWKFGSNPTSGEAITRIRVPHYCICLYCIISALIALIQGGWKRGFKGKYRRTGQGDER